MSLRKLGLVLSLSLFGTVAAADTLLIASAAGYRKPLMELIDNLPDSSGLKVEAAFGHMKQIETQAKQNPEIALLIGDLKFLKPMDLADVYNRLGTGRLAVVYAKDKKLEAIEDLKKDEFKSFATPNHRSAIYGLAAIQCLENLELLDSLKDKMVESDTVPQVGTYVALGEMDAGFVNHTEALAQGDRFGGYILAPEACYEPVVISMARMRNHADNKAVDTWFEYIESGPAREILKRYGLD